MEGEEEEQTEEKQRKGTYKGAEYKRSICMSLLMTTYLLCRVSSFGF